MNRVKRPDRANLGEVLPHGSVTACPKCGDLERRGVGYCGPQNDFGVCRQPVSLPEMLFGTGQGVIAPSSAPSSIESPRHEHLHRRCLCGYEWLEACADSPGLWTDRPAFLTE